MTAAIETVQKMMENLPESEQDDLVEHLRYYLTEKLEDAKWEEAFKKTDPKKLIAASELAQKEIAAGLAIPMDFNAL